MIFVFIGDDSHFSALNVTCIYFNHFYSGATAVVPVATDLLTLPGYDLP